MMKDMLSDTEFELLASEIEQTIHYQFFKERGYSLLAYACSCGKLDIVRYLIHKQGYPEDDNLKSLCKKSFLMIAATQGEIDIVKYLLTEQALFNSIDKTNADNYTALMYACSDDKGLKVVEYLLTSEEINEHANAYHWQNPFNIFTFACYREAQSVVDYLLFDYHIDVDKHSIQWLNENGLEHFSQLVQHRDAYFALQEKLTHKVVQKKNKI